MLPLHSAVKLLRDFPEQGLIRGTEAIVIYIFEPDQLHGLGYQLEVGPWSEHGIPSKIIDVDAEDIEKDERFN